MPYVDIAESRRRLLMQAMDGGFFPMAKEL